jgi:hypothetical protein
VASSLRVIGGSSGDYIPDNPWRQYFDRDVTTELQILGLVDLAHPALTDLVDDAVVEDGLSGE